MDDATKIQEIIDSHETELRAITVDKDIPIELDIGNLVASDINELDKIQLKDETDEYFKSLARDSVQVILNNIWELPTENIENSIYAQIPKPTTRLPREKPPPKPRAPTKWEEYAKDKGIQKKKKVKKVWDDILKEWIPRFGFRKAEADRKKNWVMEVPDGAHPYEDQFAKASEAKKERIARNEYLRLRNLARSKNVKIPSVGVTSVNTQAPKEMRIALDQTRVSTASLGKFQKPLKEDKALPEKRLGKKRKLPANDNSSDGVQRDKRRAIEVIKKMNKKKKELDYEAAVNKQVKIDNVEISQEGPKKSARRSKHGGKRRSKSEHKMLKKGVLQSLQSGKRGKGGKSIGGKVRGSKSLAGKSKGGKGRGGKARGKPVRGKSK